MSRTMLAAGIVIAVVAMLITPAAAVLPDANPLPKGVAFEAIWGFLKDLQIQINGLSFRLSEAEEAVEEAVAAIDDGDAALQAQLDAEEQDRIAADTDLKKAIQDGDAALQAAMDAGDAALQAQLNSGTASAAGLVVACDEKSGENWYFWEPGDHQCRLKCPAGMAFVNVIMDGKLGEPWDPSDQVIGATEFYSRPFDDSDTVDHFGSGYCHPTGCSAGLTECNRYCTDVSSDPVNCGSCGNTCSAPNVATYGCESGQCTIQACVKSDEYVDCDGQFNNGCEIDIHGNDPNNCGACGKVCPSGRCDYGSCIPPKT